MQVEGADEVSKVVCAVSASLELFELAAEANAELVVVHHGILWDNESRVIDARVRRRLEALFDAEITLAAYHLALDAHPGGREQRAARQRARRRGRCDSSPTSASAARPRTSREELLDARSAQRINPDAARLRRRARAAGPGRDRVRRRAAAPREAAREGYGLYLTGEPAEPSLHLAKELGITFVAAGHYATERLGVQALTQRLAERFGLEWEFVELPNPV